MSGPQQYFDEEFRAMTEGLELKKPHRLYKAMAWIKPVCIAIATLAAMLACTMAAGTWIYVAPVAFAAGVLGLAMTLPGDRARLDLQRIRRSRRPK